MPETIGTAYIQIEPSVQGISGKIEKELGGAGQSGGKSFGAAFTSVLGGVSKAAIAATTAAAGAVTGLVSSAVSAYGNYEQLAGGVETLFGDSVAKTVVANAEKAFGTAGLSANQYMETVTSFSASLLQSLGGDAEAAASVADRAIIDMSDNANKMGTSMESIQNAYQGFAKQNYTMLDNLKLGYGGNQSEMQRLIKDAAGMTDEMAKLGVTVDASSMSFDNIVNAISVMQEHMGLAGATEEEAAETLEGSTKAMKASWENLVTALGNGNADVGSYVETLVGNIGIFADNIMPIVDTALEGITTLISEVGPVIAEKIPELISANLPKLLDASLEIVETLGNGIIEMLPSLMPTITELIISLGEMLISLAPQLLEVGLQVIIQLAQGIAEAIPELLPTIIEVITQIGLILIENAGLLLSAAVEIIIALAKGLWDSRYLILDGLVELVTAMVDGFKELKDNFKEVGTKVVETIRDSIQDGWEKVKSIAGNLITKLKESFLEKIEKFKEVGSDIVAGIKKGITEGWTKLKEHVSELAGKLLDGAKSALGIHSPSKLFRDEVGYQIPLGIVEGVRKGMNLLDATVKEMSLGTLNATVANYTPGQITNYSVAGSESTSQAGESSSQTNITVTLEGDAKRLFRMMQREAQIYETTTGKKAFA